MRVSFYRSLEKKIIQFNTLILLPLLLSVSTLNAQTPPTAQFSGSQDICVNTQAGFTNQSTPGSSQIISYTWDFGDGNSSTSANPVHTYTAPGVYTVTLVVQAANGQADSEVKVNYITVRPKPQANFSVSANGCTLPVGVIYSNSSTGASSYSWNFGNGQTSIQQNPPVINYTSAGNYTGTLIATNEFGCKDTVSQPIVVSNFQAGINAPATVCAGTPVTISDNSTVGANSWNWSFPGGTPGSATSSSNSVTYNTPGTYTISLSSQNTGLGCSASATSTITVLPIPTPSFTNSPATGCAPLPVNFTNTGQQPGATYYWDFGDGNSSTQANPTNIYNGNGTYQVSLTMTASNGCSNTVSLPAVTLSSPVADFTSNVTEGCAELDVQFTSTSTSPDPIVDWIWNFGDGTSFTGQTPPVHTYDVGIYDVTLVIITQNGCIDTIVKPEYIRVGAIDLINFSLHESPQCVKTDIDFTDLSVITALHTPDEVTYNWNFGDGNTSGLQHPSHSYAVDTGYFDVTLIINFRGCIDTLVMTDAVYIKAPLSRFTPNTSLICNPQSLPVTVNVNDDAIIGVLSDDCLMIWKWGDGSQTTLSNSQLDAAGNGSSSHQYLNYGSYTIEQVIHNYTTGCSDSSTQIVHISQTIASIAGLSNDSTCVGDSFQLSQNSTSTHPFGTYTWNMGNGTIVTGANPTYTYTTYGTYSITLTATNDVGCSGTSVFTPFTALALPQAAITADNTAGCAPFLVTFSNGSTPVNNGVPLESFLFTFQDDGSTQTTSSVAVPVTHTFNSEGNFAVSLVATDEFGCVSPPSGIVITITKPNAVFSIDSVVCAHEQVETVNASDGAVPVTYQWFVDGSLVGNNVNYSAQYGGTAGTSSTQHNYTLIATDVNGCKDTMSSVLTISTPVADAGYTLSGASVNAEGQYTCPPVFTSFTDDSDTYGNITGYVWVFGDGKSSTLENPNNTYVFPGTYSFSLTITDEFGCSDSTVYIDYLTIFGPEATPGWSQSPDQCGQIVTFGLSDTNYISNITWDLGDGTTVNDLTTFTHHYTSINSFVPSVTVSDDNNCQVIYPMDTIHIIDTGLEAYFTASPSEADLGQEIILNDMSSSVNSTITSWSWYVGSYGNFFNTSGAPLYIGYGIPGYYDVLLVIQDDNGCSDSYTQTIHVSGDFTMPNVFTPNGDGANDYFSFAYDIFQSYDLIILNRWGNVIVEGKGMTGTQFWDGTTQNGSLCSEGVYFYKFSGVLKDGTTTFSKDGFITLVR